MFKQPLTRAETGIMLGYPSRYTFANTPKAAIHKLMHGSGLAAAIRAASPKKSRGPLSKEPRPAPDAWGSSALIGLQRRNALFHRRVGGEQLADAADDGHGLQVLGHLLPLGVQAAQARQGVDHVARVAHQLR